MEFGAVSWVAIDARGSVHAFRREGPIRDAGALIVGHRKARQGLLQHYERATDIPKTTPPMVTYEDSLTLFLGDKEVRVSFLSRVYTEGDSVIYPPEQRPNHAAFSA